MKLLDRLNELKNQSGLNAKQLTSELGISSTSFTDWNKGKGSPSLDAIIRFAEYFQVSLDYLVFGNDSAVKLEFSNPKEKDLLEKYRQLPVDLQEKMLGYLDGMLAVLPTSESKDEKRLSV